MCQAWALTALQVRFELGGLAITFNGHALTQTRGVLRQVQNIGVTPFSRHGVALGHGHGRGGTYSCSGKGVANEITSAFFAFGKDLLDATGGQEIFRCFLHPS